MTTRCSNIRLTTFAGFISIIVLVHLIGQTGCLTETFSKCCGLGESWADSGVPCAEFPPPVAGVAREQQPVCLATVEICCSRRRRAVQCEAGRLAARRNLDCASADEFYKNCCEACNLGLLIGSSGSGCALDFSFGTATDPSFDICCQEVARNVSQSQYSTRAPDAISLPAPEQPGNDLADADPILAADLCAMLPGELCAHVCRPVAGSYVCECRPGFTLMADGKSCQLTDVPDRCIESNPCNHKCLDTGYAIQCSCEPGYELTNDKVTCADVDECARGTHDCPANKTCVNTVGAFACKAPGMAAGKSALGPKEDPRCPEGYQFNEASRVCDDIDECQTKLVKCANCHNTIGSYKCVEEGPTPNCPKGYKYDEIHLTCIDVDECVEGTHDCNRQSQFCLNTQGGFTCQNKASKNSCPAGFKFNTDIGTCEDIDECLVEVNAGGICAEGEICVNEPGQYRCVAYQGPTQESLSALIPENEVLQRYEAAQQDIITPAAAKKTSTKNQGVPRTTTEETRLKGSTAASESHHSSTTPSTKPISPKSTLSPAPAGVSCKAGFKLHPLTDACVDVNECSDRRHTCDSTQDCINLPGSYACQCKSGYTLDHVTQGCVDINECLTRRHACLESQRCDNTIGSYQCIRYINCGTGYTLNAATGGCEDDDECSLGLHDCHRLGPAYRCRNTQGSYRCVRARETSKIVQAQYEPPPRPRCPAGYERVRDVCADINECQRENACTRHQRCINTVGSYSCVNTVKCRHGFKLNEDNRCEDIDECSEGLHECTGGQLCKNRAGSYVCHCAPGHRMTEDKTCEDVNECEKFGPQICHRAVCRNTVGSYRCDCKPGYRQREDGQRCTDVDECRETPGLCQHKCHNLWGGYRCSCQAGFKLHSNNRSCVDIDECEEFKDRYLCIGICKNTPGSYECQCPSGYKIGSDGRTCQDIDECTVEQPCDPSSVCINTRGSYECYDIQCPPNYIKDRKKYNTGTCKKASDNCDFGDDECINAPWTYSYNFINFVSGLPIPRDKGYFELFEIRTMSSNITYEMVHVSAPAGVEPATRESFSLRLIEPNAAIISLVKSLVGPQQIELEITIKYYSKGVYQGKKVCRLFIYVSQYDF